MRLRGKKFVGGSAIIISDGRRGFVVIKNFWSRDAVEAVRFWNPFRMESLMIEMLKDEIMKDIETSALQKIQEDRREEKI